MTAISIEPSVALLLKQRMPHNSSPVTKPFLASPRPLATYERGRDLCTFVSTAATHVMRTLQRPCRSKPRKRKVNHRRFLQNQIFRSFSDIEAATRRLASSILSQEACVAPAPIQQRAPARPRTLLVPPIVSSFSGIAEAFVAPDPSPGWALSLDALTSDPDELFEPITRETEPAAAHSWEPLSLDRGSTLVGWAAPSHVPHPLTGSATCVEPMVYPSVAADCCSPALEVGSFVIPDHDTYMPLLDLEMW
ncbi:uncharacterized protein C19orf85 homolog [Sceloporus undulatus]|uniref:uncharacterized protein C19orf85 homolog n=1 Tax=Sceloporus undulatus TaxID=8520 RepID=UPI001C4C5AE0|nr:uncharacterized protein C19orf85 homolog [Sceloporus undulatus]